jgi:hypothetical protein
MYLFTCTGDFVTIRTKAFPKSLRLAAILLVSSASLISTAWSQLPQPHVVVGRLQIPAIYHALKLAEPNQISIQTGGEKVTSVWASWTYFNIRNIPHPAVDEDRALPVNYDSSGGAFVTATPLKLGKAQLSLFVGFADGGFERKTIDVQVVQPERPPERLVIATGGVYGREMPVLSLDLSDRYKTVDVDPAAIYKNVASPVPLNASDVTFKWINSPNPTAAEIDPKTGIVTARSIGQVLLETSFGGVSVLTCIDVMNNVLMGPSSSCKELLPPGRRLPPSEMELDNRPAPVVKARPH